MHAYDRTLIASLGFADPDKGEPLHDLACAYIAEPKVVRALFRAEPAKKIRMRDHYNGDGRRFDGVIGQKTTYGAQLEVPLLKGRGRYQTTVGFLDALLTRETAQS